METLEEQVGRMLNFIQEQAGRIARQSRWLAVLAGLMIPALVVALVYFYETSRESLRDQAHAPSGFFNPNPTKAPQPPDLETQLLALGRDLSLAPTPIQAIEQMVRLRAFLENLPPDVASLVIRECLDSKIDYPTKLGFKLDSQGRLTEAPTLRTFLLDYQGRLDPEEAAQYAARLLETSASPDEWALALRNLAVGKSGASSRSLLTRKLKALLLHEAWQQQPSAGYLEAFDVVVHVGGDEFVPILTSLIRPVENQALAHAAYMALDRLTINDPTETLKVLLVQPGLMNGREIIRAGYFARAQVDDPQQRQLIESYLLSPGRSDAELKTFANLFPNANFLVSNNLLTRTPTPDHETLVQTDRASLRVVKEWMNDRRFQSLQPHMKIIQTRLLRFVNQTTDSRRGE